MQLKELRVTNWFYVILGVFVGTVNFSTSSDMAIELAKGWTFDPYFLPGYLVVILVTIASFIIILRGVELKTSDEGEENEHEE